MKNIIKSIKKRFIIENPPYEYDFLINLDKKKYPRYLKKIFEKITGEKLNLKNPKTFNEKIQWLKLYDTTPLKTQLTDKILVREWVKGKIGEGYLKPVLALCNNFDEINFEKLPNSFIIKTNHGCKWHFKIKSKSELLSNENLKKYVKKKFDGWLNQTFFPWAGFEMQYKDIVPKIIIEPILTDEKEEAPVEIEIYCFNGVPKIYQRVKYTNPPVCCVYNENLTESTIKFNSSYINESFPADSLLKEAINLSKILCNDFKLVRVDWLIYRDRIYFNEMTFTPMSGFYIFEDEKINKALGSMLKIR